MVVRSEGIQMNNLYIKPLETVHSSHVIQLWTVFQPATPLTTRKASHRLKANSTEQAGQTGSGTIG